MSHSICISSEDSMQHYTGNCAIDFISVLPTSLDLNRQYEIALIDYQLIAGSIPIEETHINVHCNIVNESYVNGKMQPILRPLYIKRNVRQYHEFRYPLYIAINTNQIRFIHVQITNNKNSTPAFSIESFKCTLLLRPIKM